MASALLPHTSEITSGSILSQIGNTPLVHLPGLSAKTPGVHIYAKDESRNPGGSVKDRPAWNMIVEGERAGLLTSGKTILDASSGNTGIAYAMIGAARGYSVTICLPRNASHERKRILKAYGAEVVLTPADEGSDGAIREVRKIFAADPDRYFYADQYNNPANWQAHYNTTAVEILEQTAGKLTHFVAMLGTSGTCVGITRRLRKEAPHVRCISGQPSTGFHGIEGTKHMPTAIVPGIWDASLPDENLWIETEDAHAMTRRVARDEGLLVGVSAGANLYAAHLIARRLHEAGETGLVVTILCDGADKYLSEQFWDDQD
ncbi:MAG: cysteine synthase family protein [Bryobacteraceae bacterium]|nr:cysteine synthase family protein [Bryobacteraceae bacterium]